MNTYIVAYSYFGNITEDITMRKVEAETAADAMIDFLVDQGWNWDEDEYTEDEVKDIAFDNDCLINAYKL